MSAQSSSVASATVAVSVVVLTFNEAANLPRCLASVAWADDVLVLDSGSTDGTVDVARRHGARVLQRPFDSFGAQRNYAMEAGDLRGEWVLHLDADEAVPGSLRTELQQIMRAGTHFDAFRVPARILLGGHWLRHAGMYPSYQVRFGRRDCLRFLDHGHGQREDLAAERVGTLQHPLDHHNFSKGLNDWFARHLRYARAEALQQHALRAPIRITDMFAGDPVVRRRSAKAVAERMPLRPLLRFLYVYIARGGALDGRAGLDYALMLAVYQFFIDLNLRELRRGGVS